MHQIVLVVCLVHGVNVLAFNCNQRLWLISTLACTLAPGAARAILASFLKESTMVCPACLTAMAVSQLPAISAAVVSAAGVKLAYDQKRSTATEVEDLKPRKVTVLKVCLLWDLSTASTTLSCISRLRKLAFTIILLG